VKRFSFDISDNTPVCFISDSKGSYLVEVSDDLHPQFEIIFGGKNVNRDPEKVDAEEFIAKKGLQAKGKKVSPFDVKSVAFVEPLVKEGDAPAASDEEPADGIHAGENQAGEIDNSDVEDPLDLNIDDDDAQLSLF
jgi:topoisomerase-4 subunit A